MAKKSLIARDKNRQVLELRYRDKRSTLRAIIKDPSVTLEDKLVAQKLAYVMCGGDLSEASLVSEQYLLDLEREAFLSLCGQKKTLERIQSVMTSGKPIRN
jgi:3-hydroxyacyl-CoA dehydrogenase